MAHPNNGRFVWHELMTKDPVSAIAFYTEVIGWKTEAFGEGGNYTMWVGSQGPLGGVMTIPEEATKMGAPPHWMGNVRVENVDASAALTRKLGGKVYKEAESIPTVGRFAVIADPFGAPISIFQPEREMAPHDASRAGEFCWAELMTTDQVAAFAFYSEIFGWRKLGEHDMGPMGSYVIFGVGDVQIGGMMNRPKDMPTPPMWGYYSETKGLDAAVARATKHGAKVLNGPMDVPGGARIAQLMDPQGAAFSLHEAPKK